MVFQAAAWLFGMMPLAWVQRIAGFLGTFAHTALGLRRGIVRENLSRAFPDEPQERLNEIAGAVYRNVAVSLCELLWFPSLSPERLRELVELNDRGLFRTLHARGKGIVIVTAHVGNWELVPPAVFLMTGIPVHSLYKPQSNRLIDERIAARRTRFGTTVVPMGLGVREILRSLQQGDAVLVAADQSAPKESIRLDFFGRAVPVFQGPAAFSLKSGAAMISVFAIRQADGRYILRCKEIPTSDLEYSEESIRILTQRHLAVTEEVIREYPGQWMWTHRRWKHAEDGEEEKGVA
jgi:KDO2-lipid IV(A) lauroyltransferase